MELLEPVDILNKRLGETFGMDSVSGSPIWRVVFSNDLFEKRLGTWEDYSEGGIYLRTVTEVREVPKYNWINDRYVLERLVVVPDHQVTELAGMKMSYEPIYVFQTGSGQYLPPKWEAAEFVIYSIYAVQGSGDLARYKDPEFGLNKEEQFEAKSARINKLQEELFGNESLVGDALAHGDGVVVPFNFKVH